MMAAAPSRNAPEGLMLLTVLAFEKLTERIARIHLGHADGRPLPAVQAGGHIEVLLRGPDGAIRRAYSVVNPGSSTTCYEIAVQREDQGGGGSLQMHGLSVGSTVQVVPAKNGFGLCAAARHHLLIAGGIGITPILAMARTLAAQGGSFRLGYAARSRAEAAYVQEVEAWACASCGFDGGVPGRGLNLQALLPAHRDGQHVYVCGPRGLIAAVVEAARSRGWPEEAIHYELFAGVLEHRGERLFHVRVQGSDRSYPVPPGRTILDVLEAAGLPVLYDCRRGECGVCTAKVVAGIPEHRDASLTAAERACGLICPCVSRSSSDELVLEL